MPTLSDRLIRDSKPGATEKWISDGAGLYIRIRPNGTKTWFIRRKRAGKTTTETLGEFPGMNCAAARTALAKRSFTPTPDKITFGDLLDEWYSRRIEPKYRVVKNIKTYVERAKSEFGGTALHRLTTQQLVKWLQAYADKTPVAANRCSSNLKLALNYAVQCGYINHNPLQTVTTKVIGGEEESRERVLTDDEIRAVWNSQQKILKFLLLTGLRISEAQHGHQDGDKFHIARTKNGDPHWVFLPDFAAEQLEPFTTSPTAVQSKLKRWCAKYEITPFTPHDLRRTFATRLGDLGIEPYIIEKCLNHKMQGVMGIYNRAEYEQERIDAAEAWAAELQRIITSKTAASR
jgi:integrase